MQRQPGAFGDQSPAFRCGWLSSAAMLRVAITPLSVPVERHRSETARSGRAPQLRTSRSQAILPAHRPKLTITCALYASIYPRRGGALFDDWLMVERRLIDGWLMTGGRLFNDWLMGLLTTG